jgi:hypothetical protein
MLPVRFAKTLTARSPPAAGRRPHLLVLGQHVSPVVVLPRAGRDARHGDPYDVTGYAALAR